MRFHSTINPKYERIEFLLEHTDWLTKKHPASKIDEKYIGSHFQTAVETFAKEFNNSPFMNLVVTRNDTYHPDTLLAYVPDFGLITFAEFIYQATDADPRFPLSQGFIDEYFDSIQVSHRFRDYFSLDGIVAACTSSHKVQFVFKRSTDIIEGGYYQMVNDIGKKLPVTTYDEYLEDQGVGWLSRNLIYP